MQKAAPYQPPDASAKTADRSIRREDRPMRAIALILVATCFFGLIDASGKYLVSTAQLPATQVVWVRFLGQLLAIVAMLGILSVPGLLRSKRKWTQLIRSTLLMLSTLFNFLALRHLRLDQTVTIQFLAPLTVALLAGPVLGEWVGWRRFLAILVGFGGILIAIRPGASSFEPAFILALLCMLSYAIFMIVTRMLAGQDSAETTLFYSLLVGTYFTAPFAIVDWVWPQDRITTLVVMFIGVWGAIGHYLFIVAYRFAPASTLAPFTYASLITHSTLGFLIFGQFPDHYTLAGAAVVIASGLYLLHRERVTAKTRERAGTRASGRPRP